MNDIVTLKPLKVTYTMLINVRHWSGDDYTKSIRIKTESPLGSFAVGDQLRIGDLDGFPESRRTTGKVRSVVHSLGGNTVCLDHQITVNVDEDREP